MSENKPENQTFQGRKFGLSQQAIDNFHQDMTKICHPDYEPPQNPSQTAADKLKSEIDSTKQRAIDAEKNSITDSLTGLYNRRYLDDYTERFDKARNKKPVFVAFCDADNLGLINKTKGDKYGDKLIQNIAGILKESVRSEDLIIRKGGDEFVIIIEDFSNYDELKSIISQRLESKQTSEIKFSFGIVQYNQYLDKSFTDTIQRGNDQMRINNPNKTIPKH